MTKILTAVSYAFIFVMILWILKNSIFNLLQSISYLDPVTKIYVCVGFALIIVYYGFQG